MDSYFPDLGTIWRSLLSLIPRPLYSQGNICHYLLDSRLSGPRSQSGRGKENILDSQVSNSDPSVVEPAAIRYTKLTHLKKSSVTFRKFEFMRY
jgi:hypothetical protein